MNILEEMISRYETSTETERDHAIREVLQELTLYSLSKTDFFNRASFMGGTALRILHGLDRFSEGLDFILKTADPEFSIETYIPEIERQMNVYGLDISVEPTTKKTESNIKEGVLKSSTRNLYLKFFSDKPYFKDIYGTQLTKIKLEIDISPAKGARSENVFRTSPYGYRVTACDMPTMFSGKLHAILCRPWSNRFKGRDLYDYLFYLDRKTPYNIEFLNNKLSMSGIDVGNGLSHRDIVAMLNDRFREIDYDTAKQDVVPFLNPEALKSTEIWCPEMFIQLTSELREK
ncbi:nucleotidyl transferase AbiEii/AbiGii toxin family protein [Methanomassiliicoccales archaeon LGM-RCC1]|nr:nucleotidyl transferase AbiEii/AbiGii toxin family protein [Methanomassiliicoccales archaeon LGM-RCC1]